MHDVGSRLTENQLCTQEDALNYINECGFVTLFQIRNSVFPSLYQAVKGDRKRKLDNTWKWADSLAQKKLIHYGKLIHEQVTLISLEMFPYFYRAYQEKGFNGVPREILKFLKKKGATSITTLRRELNFQGKAKKSEFVKALDELQLAFAIAIVDRKESPRMTYTWDLLERWMPKELLEKAETLDALAAKEKIAQRLQNSESINQTRSG
jgi:hypothetical protein